MFETKAVIKEDSMEVGESKAAIALRVVNEVMRALWRVDTPSQGYYFQHLKGVST